MIPVDYIFYSTVYGGQMDEADFSRLSIRAAAFVDYITFGRANNALPEALQRQASFALCAVADGMKFNAAGGPVVSEINDGISVTYASASDARTADRRLYDAAALYLAQTGLMFRGC